MKKLILALTAICFMGVSVPAYSDAAPPKKAAKKVGKKAAKKVAEQKNMDKKEVKKKKRSTASQ